MNPQEWSAVLNTHATDGFVIAGNCPFCQPGRPCWQCQIVRLASRQLQIVAAAASVAAGGKERDPFMPVGQ
jgi:hypothetical protein